MAAKKGPSKKGPRKRTSLTMEQKIFVTTSLAQYEGLKRTAELLHERFGVTLAVNNIQVYDPTTFAGRKLSVTLRKVFDEAREAFHANLKKHVPLASKDVRIRKLASFAQQFEQKGNFRAAADMLERISKEVGNVNTNRREFTGKDGGPIQFEEISDDDLYRELASYGFELEESADGGDSATPEAAKPH